MRPLVVIGLFLAIVGLVALTYPAFTTNETKNVANIGPIHVQKNEEQTHVIPPLASGAILALGVALLAGGLLTKPRT
jgi:uncharacterized membrane protein HdeD (DUF308 family)